MRMCGEPEDGNKERFAKPRSQDDPLPAEQLAMARQPVRIRLSLRTSLLAPDWPKAG